MRSTIEWGTLHPKGLQLPMRWSPEALEDAYKRCGSITADYAKTFYLVRLHLSLSLPQKVLSCQPAISQTLRLLEQALSCRHCVTRHFMYEEHASYN